jgi:hypothetical protein
MTAAEYRARVSEADFEALVRRYAALRGWRLMHIYDARRSAEGWPDLSLVRGERLIFAELKTARGKVTPAQQEWLGALAGVPGVLAEVWRPDSWPHIEEVLE